MPWCATRIDECAGARPVAKAARDDGHDLSLVRGLHDGQRNERRVQIHGLNAQRTEFMPMRRQAVDLLVRRIQNRVCVIGRPVEEQLVR